MAANVLLINPPPISYLKRSNETFRSLASMPPIGLLSLASSTRAYGHSVKIIDMLSGDASEKEFRKVLLDNRWDAVGITAFTECYYNAIEIGKKVKELSPSTKVILGGAHPTFIYEEALKTGSVDFVVRGEGDFSFPALINMLGGDAKASAIQGIAYSRDGIVLKTPRKGFIHNLDELPFPAYDLIDIHDYLYPNVMVSGRGCPGRCIFCAAKALHGGKYRFKSAEKTVEEFERLYKMHRYPYIAFVDDAFTASSERLLRICKLLKNRKIGVEWSCESRCDAVSESILKEMHESGCIYIQFGMESGSQEILDKIGKRVTITQIENCVKWATQAGMEVKISYMIGHYPDTSDTITQTLKFAERLWEEYGVEPAPSINTPFPGTFQYAYAEKLGIKILTKDWSQYRCDNCVIETSHLTREEIQSFYYDALRLVNRARVIEKMKERKYKKV